MHTTTRFSASLLDWRKEERLSQGSFTIQYLRNSLWLRKAAEPSKQKEDTSLSGEQAETGTGIDRIPL